TTGDYDLWLMDSQVEFSEESKPLLDTTVDRVRGVEGVEWAVPYYKGLRTARLPDGTLKSVSVVGLDDASLMGAPPRMVEGELASLREDQAVLMDASELGKNFSFDPGDGTVRPMQMGDTFTIGEESVKVTGIYGKEKSFFWQPVVYTTYSRALRIAPPDRKLLTNVLIKVKPGFDAASVAKRITEQTGHKVLNRQEYILLTAWYVLFKTGILINFSISVGLGLVIGILVSAQTFYNFILDNLRHFGTMKAVGVPNHTIVLMVMLQILVVGGIGYGIGVGMASALGSVFSKVGPGAWLLPWQIPAFVAVSIFGASILAGFISLIKVLRLEPAIVFRS
ncbi:MAG: ABC transporter permease, partial [Candidatus Sumerlaeia bacterium]|nr:ABC transporter permease [Candidatus Sumerlaeia bacterium]